MQREGDRFFQSVTWRLKLLLLFMFDGLTYAWRLHHNIISSSSLPECSRYVICSISLIIMLRRYEMSMSSLLSNMVFMH